MEYNDVAEYEALCEAIRHPESKDVYYNILLVPTSTIPSKPNMHKS